VAESGNNYILKAVEVAPYALLRIAALPFHHLTDMALEQTWLQLAAERSAQASLQAIGSAVTDEIHALIPTTQDSMLRRSLLALKRAAHAGRMEVRTADLEIVGKALAGWPELQHLGEWIELHGAYRAACRAADEAAVRDIDARTRPAMRLALASPAFSYALAISSPRLYERLTRYEDFNDGKAGTNKSERSLMNYLGRAAAKTSPLSTFMFTAWIENVGAQKKISDLNIAQDYAYVIETQLTRGVVARICRYAMKDAEVLSEPNLIPNPSLIFTEARVRAVAHTYIELLGRAWRQERVTTFTLPAHVALILREFMQVESKTSIEQRFVAAGIASAEARKWIAQLLDRGLVFSAPLWGPQTIEPLAALINAVRPVTSVRAATLFATLDETRSRVAAIDLAQPHEVVALHADIDSLVDKAHTLLGGRFCKPFQSNLSQNVMLKGVHGGFGAALNELVEELGAELANHVTVAHEYGVVLQLFLAKFGTGGSCDNLLEFLIENYADYVDGCINKSSASVSMADAVLGVTTYVQLLAPSLAEIDGGQAHLVANLIYERAGWQAARYLPLDVASEQRERGMISAWLRALAGDAEPVEMSFSGDCNGLQAHPAVTARVLGWPGEGAATGGDTVAIDPRTISVVHDPISNRLRFYDSAALEIVLMYLGGVMPMPSWGISHMLIKMAEPLSIHRPDHLFGQHGQGRQVTAQPRIAKGRVTLFRASWLVDAATIYALLESPGYVAQIRAMQAFFNEHSMPRFTYVSADIAYSPTDAQRLNLDRLRKPTWFDIANPVCLDLLRRLCTQTDKLTFREALPGEQDLWLKMGENKHVSEIQVELKIQVSIR
jgi:hypothetical protein